MNPFSIAEKGWKGQIRHPRFYRIETKQLHNDTENSYLDYGYSPEPYPNTLPPILAFAQKEMSCLNSIELNSYQSQFQLS